VLGAFFTVLLYGVLPLGIVLYVMGTPGRKAQRRAREAAELAALAGAKTPTHALASEVAAPTEAAAKPLATAPQATGPATSPTSASVAPDGCGQPSGAHIAPK
jgi:hypothetical protein